jgi:hypothetical protein
MINKSKFLVLILGGLLISGALAVSAFTEPTALPGGTTSYPPLHLGKGIQVRLGKLGIGDGANQADSNGTNANSLYLLASGAGENVTVRQNATLVGNVWVQKDFVVGGAIRVPGVQACFSGNGGYGGCGSSNFSQLNDYNQNKGIFTVYGQNSNTNLGMGNTCTVTNSSCPSGSILSKFNSSTGVSTCRKINPSSSPKDLGGC